MNTVEQQFHNYWLQHSDISIIPQFRPIKELYDSQTREEKFLKWCKLHGWNDYRGDFLFDNKLIVEFDGTGAAKGKGKYGHEGAGAEADRKKTNMFLKLGYPTARFSCQTVKNSTPYVFDEILEMLEGMDERIS